MPDFTPPMIIAVTALACCCVWVMMYSAAYNKWVVLGTSTAAFLVCNFAIVANIPQFSSLVLLCLIVQVVVFVLLGMS